MSGSGAARLAWGPWWVVLSLAALTVVFAILAHQAGPRDLGTGIVAIVVFQVVATVGAIIFCRRPENAVSDGRLPSPRWLPVGAWLIGTLVLFTVRPTSLDAPLAHTPNPLGVPSALGAFEAVGIFGGVVLFVVCLASLVVRYRRPGIEGQQIKRFLLAAAFVMAFVLVAAFAFPGVPGALWLVVFATIPISTGIAILRYRLNDIDRVIDRAVVYGVVSAALTGLYFAIVLLLEQPFGSFTRGNDLAIAGSTLAVAALFRPGRGCVQTFVDRRFFRRKYDAEQTLAAFASRLHDQIDLEALGLELCSVVRQTMQPAHVSLRLREGR